jgi:hypothetical protein
LPGCLCRAPGDLLGEDDALASKNLYGSHRGPASGGKVFVEGEYWSATSDTFVKKGELVQIIAVEGLTTKVKPENRERGPMFEESARLVVWLVPIILIAVIFLPQMIRILREYERGVIFRLGKLLGTKGPGLIFLIPIVDRMVRMDLRVVTIDVARQEVPRSRFLFQKVAGFEVVNFDL